MSLATCKTKLVFYYICFKFFFKQIEIELKKRKYKTGGHESDSENHNTNPNGWYNNQYLSAKENNSKQHNHRQPSEPTCGYETEL